MPSRRIAVSFSIIGSCSMCVSLLEIFRTTDGVVRWSGSRRRRRWRYLIERVFQDRFNAFVAASAGEQRTLASTFHALRGVFLRQPDDAQTSAITHLRMRLVVHDALEQPCRVWADRLGPVRSEERRVGK